MFIFLYHFSCLLFLVVFGGFEKPQKSKIGDPSLSLFGNCDVIPTGWHQVKLRSSNETFYFYILNIEKKLNQIYISATDGEQLPKIYCTKATVGT